jgi:hypothetical protein
MVHRYGHTTGDCSREKLRSTRMVGCLVCEELGCNSHLVVFLSMYRQYWCLQADYDLLDDWTCPSHLLLFRL